MRLVVLYIHGQTTMRIHYFVFVGILLLANSMDSVSANSEVIRSLQINGHIALMRHSIAPGNGDPATFSIEDCSTQRNLSAEGRKQARTTGDFLRANGVKNLHIYSSQWCRCVDTAKLLDYGKVNELSILNSFYAQRELEPSQTRALKQWIFNRSDPAPAILVTHQVNITSLTGIYPSSGEIVVVKISESDLEVIGTIEPPLPNTE